MGKIAYLLTKGSITLQYDGQTKVVAAQDERFGKVLAAIRAGKMDEVPEIVDPSLDLRRKGLEVEEGLIKIQGEAMPPELNLRIMEYKDQKMPFQSLLNFWNNLQQNPSFNSRQQLFKFLENKGHAITEDGCFIGYRGVTEDLKDVHTRTFDNSPGKTLRMPREMVDDNPNNTCSNGFHVGAYDYAKGFGKKLVIVKVNPADVVAVPNDYNGQKMRVCAFEVLSEAQARLEESVVTKTGEKIEKFDSEDEDSPSRPGEPLKGDALELFKESERAKKRAHKRRYANNHAKRGPDGKFASKKKKRRSMTAISKDIAKNNKRRTK